METKKVRVWPLLLGAVMLLVGTSVGTALVVVSRTHHTARTTATEADAPVAVTVAASEWKLTPASARAGRPVSVTFTNDGKMPHQIAVDAGHTFTTPMLQAGESSTLQIGSFAPGTYHMFCTIPGHREAGMESTLVVNGAAPSVGPMNMDAMEEAALKAFPAKTEGTGNQPLAPKIVNGVKVFELTAKAIKWESSPGQFVDAYAYNGQIPGPVIRAKYGDRIRIVLRNELPESTTIHFHGLTVPNAMDGVPFLTQPPVKTGESFTYEFPVVDAAGTYMYHTHMNAQYQMSHGLYGAFVIDDPKPQWTSDQIVFLGDGPLGFNINAKGFPATQPIVAKLGQKVLIRFLNGGELLHPMHLHGFHFAVIGEDGRRLSAPYSVDTLVVAPGERYDVVFDANLAGVWAFHCHILSHAESDHGMYGMVTAVVVK